MDCVGKGARVCVLGARDLPAVARPLGASARRKK